MVGKTVSHYKILEKLGEGGMGVVYKAEDLKLTRTVALKFLPHDSQAQERDRTRFLQEARAAAILNHPNICTIHDIQEHEGQLYIVMEYVQGKTLREILPVRRIQDAITYAIQIAEALQEAHTNGIVHRDIKADNIMVNSKDQVKVMDFGLAKLKGSLKLTRTGYKVGTLAYMAPEQIRGEQADERSDIFSFGIVLHEMLTGHLPFRGEHEAAMVYSIMNEDPEPLEHLLPDAPSELLHVLDRALEKDPEDRYQAVHEMLIDLRRLKKETSRDRHTPPAGIEDPANGRPPHSTNSAKKWVAVACGAGVVAAGIVLYSLLFSPHLPRLNPHLTSRAVDIPFSEIGYPSLSDDGKWIAFAAADIRGKWDFYFMHVAGSELKRVTFDSLPFANQSVAISPDGSHFVYDFRNFRKGISELHIASPLTAESRRLVDTGYGPVWRPDGGRIGYMRYGGQGSLAGISGKPEFWTIRPDGTDKKLEFADTLSRGDLTLCYAWSPDGNSVAYLSTRAGNTQEVFIRDLRTGSERQITHLNSKIDNTGWADNGWVFFSSNKGGTTNLWIVDPRGGEPVEFTQGTSPYLNASFSRDCLTILANQRMQVSTLWIADLQGQNATAITSDDRLYSTPSFSPDDKRIVFAMGSADPMAWIQEIYTMDCNGERRQQITSGDQNALYPVWSPDGRWIAYASFENGAYTSFVNGRAKCFVVDVTNPALSKQVGENIPVLWMNNGSFLAYRDSTRSCWATFLDGRQQRKFAPDSIMALPVLSGKLLLISDSRRGREGLYAASIDYLQHPSDKMLRLLHKFQPASLDWSAIPSPGGSFALVYNNRQGMWKINFPSCSEERLHGPFPEFGLQEFRISNDGKKIVYAGTMRTKSQMVLMENPFE